MKVALYAFLALLAGCNLIIGVGELHVDPPAPDPRPRPVDDSPLPTPVPQPLASEPTPRQSPLPET